MEPAVAGDMSATFRNMKFEDEPTPLPIHGHGERHRGLSGRTEHHQVLPHGFT